MNKKKSWDEIMHMSVGIFPVIEETRKFEILQLQKSAGGGGGGCDGVSTNKMLWTFFQTC